MDRIEKTNAEQTFLTMCHPAMFTLITGSQVNLPWLKTFTCAIYQCTADGLEKRNRKYILTSFSPLVQICCESYRGIVQ